MDQLAPVLILIALFLIALVLMRWGWTARERRQSGLPAPESPVPAAVWSATDTADGIYVSTVLAGSPLDRVAAHGLGTRARARIEIGHDAAEDRDAWVIRRQGSRDLLIPSAAIEELDSAPGMAGKWIGGDGLLVIRWRLGDQLLDTGLRLDHRADHDRLLSSTTLPRKEHP